VTAPGRRTLSFWLANPLADVAAIEDRQGAVAELIARGAALEELRAMLHGVADLARIASRVAGRRVRPPELGVLRSGLRTVERVPAWLAEGPVGPRLTALTEESRPPNELVSLLSAALPDELPNREDAGPLFRPGHAPEVDRWREAERSALQDLTELERSEQEASGIKTLKI